VPVTLETKTMNTKIICDRSLILNNSSVQELVKLAVALGAQATPEGDTVVYEMRPESLSLEHAKYATVVGAKVTGYPLYIEADPDDEVPEGVPNRILTTADFDEDGEAIESTSTVKTWAEWRAPVVRQGRSFFEASDGRRYYALADLGAVSDSLFKPGDLPVAESLGEP